MTRAIERLRNLLVKEVSLVDEGDNPPALFNLWKRRKRRDRAAPKKGEPGYDPKRVRRPGVKQPTASSVHTDGPLGGDDDERRRQRLRPRRGRGKVDGDNVLAKLTVSASAQESGGVSPHEHTVELPDGTVQSGRYRTEPEQEHTHDFRISEDVPPGGSVTVETGPAEPAPPEGVEQHTHTLTFEAVESEINPEPAARQLQRTDKQEDGQDFQTRDGERFKANAFAFSPDDVPASGWKLVLYDSQADADANRPSVALTGAAVAALGPGGFRGQPVAIPPDARAGVIRKLRSAWLKAREDQDVSREDLPDVLKANVEADDAVAKLIAKWAGDALDPEFVDQLFDEVARSGFGDAWLSGMDPDDDNRNREVPQMDLSKLKKEDREKVEAALAGFDGSTEELLAAVAAKPDDDDDGDPLKGVPEEVRAVVEPVLKSATEKATAVEKENATLKERLDKVEKDRAREAFAKSVGDLTGLSEKREDVIANLWKIDDEETRATVQKNLEAAAASARRGGLYAELGSSLEGEGGGAYAKISAAAEEIRKANPGMTEAIAKSKAMELHPELYDEYLAEGSIVTN